MCVCMGWKQARMHVQGRGTCSCGRETTFKQLKVTDTLFRLYVGAQKELLGQRPNKGCKTVFKLN